MNTEHFKQKLEEERAQVEAQLRSLGVNNPKNPGDWQTTSGDIDTLPPAADANEAADKMEEFAERQEETEALEDRLNDIQAALKKISDGTYGKCEVSGEQIEEDRLEANPAARTCKAHM
ncbi:MAG: TraR/DksA C4-type zinc finger protein [Patescibacteria group bacterium]